MAELSHHLTFNTLTELERYRKDWEARGTSVGLRVNPEYSPVATDLYNPANPHGRLGETLPTYRPSRRRDSKDCTSIPSAKAMLRRRPPSLSAPRPQFGHYLAQIEWLNLGGGHLMTREGYDIDGLIATLRTLKTRYPHLKITLEPAAPTSGRPAPCTARCSTWSITTARRR